MVKGKSAKDRAFCIINGILLGLMMIAWLYPLLYVVSASFSDPQCVYKGEIYLFPKEFSLKSYKRVFENSAILSGYINSILYTGIGTLISIIVTFTTAYPITRKDMKGRNLIMFFFIIPMFFGGGLVPLYMLVDKLKITDTMFALILPCALGIWNMIVVRTYMSTSIAFELQESAMCDGANAFRIFWSIIVPLCKPMMAIMVLFYGVGYWNNYFYAMMFMSTPERFPLQLVLRNILIENDMSSMVGGSGGSQESLYEQAVIAEALKYSAIVVSTLPILAVYPFLSKYFEKGMMIGSLKG